jgi:hypothetical protein
MFDFDDVMYYFGVYPEYFLCAAVGTISAAYYAWHSVFFLRKKVQRAAAESGLVRKKIKKKRLKDSNGKIIGFEDVEIYKNIGVKFYRGEKRRITKVRVKVERGIPRDKVEAFHSTLVSLTNIEWGQFYQERGKQNIYYAVRASVGE